MNSRFSSLFSSAAPRAAGKIFQPQRPFATITKPFPQNEVVSIQVGDTLSITRSFSASQVAQFATLISDENPLHRPIAEAEAEDSSFKNPFGFPVVHGWLSGSLFSSLFSYYFPGSIYVNQQISFRAPLAFEEKVTATVKIHDLGKSSRGYVGCETIIKSDITDSIIADGTALVLIRNLKENKKKIPKFQ